MSSIICSTCLEKICPSSEDITSSPCGHIFHAHCILQWLETGKANCPQCRSRCSSSNLRKIYFTQGLDNTITVGDSEDTDFDGSANDQSSVVKSLRDQLKCAQFDVKITNEKFKKSEQTFKSADLQSRKLREELRCRETEYSKLKEDFVEMKIQMRYFKIEKEKCEKLQKELDEVNQKLRSFSLIEDVINQTAGEVNKRLHEIGTYDATSKHWCIIVEAIKHEMNVLKSENKRLEDEVRRKTISLASFKQKLRYIQEELESVNQSNLRLKREKVMLDKNKENFIVLEDSKPENDESLFNLHDDDNVDSNLSTTVNKYHISGNVKTLKNVAKSDIPPLSPSSAHFRSKVNLLTSKVVNNNRKHNNQKVGVSSSQQPFGGESSTSSSLHNGGMRFDLEFGAHSPCERPVSPVSLMMTTSYKRRRVEKSKKPKGVSRHQQSGGPGITSCLDWIQKSQEQVVKKQQKLTTSAACGTDRETLVCGSRDGSPDIFILDTP